MRKLLWCCSTAGVLAVGGMFSTAYLACRYPDSAVGRCVNAAANTSIALQPVTSLVSMVAKAAHQAITSQESTCTPGSVEECVPADPQPIDIKPAEAGVIKAGVIEAGVIEADVEPIVINEDDPMPRIHEVEALPSTIDLTGAEEQQQVDNSCPLFMPYCSDENEPTAKPSMPYAEGENTKADGSADPDDSANKAWMKLFEGASPENKPTPTEELPLPTEEPPSQSKCQEDSHLHEHYSGCPHTTCPYTGKSYPSCAPSKSGQEESSEEPIVLPKKHGKKPHGGKDQYPPPAGVDTMEYRPSDGGLNEYGPGPM